MCFVFRWRGSVYKLVYMDLVFFCVAYAAMSLVYHYLLTHDMQTYAFLSLYNIFFFEYFSLAIG